MGSLHRPDRYCAAPSPDNLIFDRTVKRLRNELDRNPHRQCAYAVLSGSKALAFLRELPNPPAFPGRVKKLIVIMSWDPEVGGWRIAALRNPCDAALEAVDKLGDVLGFLAPATEGNSASLRAALQWLLRQPDACQCAPLNPLIARALADASLAATNAAGDLSLH